VKKMVFKNIKRIQTALPEVLHIVMFYNDGIIFQTTFEQDINIPKLGENIAKMLSHVQKLYEICNFDLVDYKKLIFETENISLIIIKLGENSNLGLFFKKEEDKDLKLNAIKRYLSRIEELIDMDKAELEMKSFEEKEEDNKK